MAGSETEGDAIHLETIELQARIGVPEEERTKPQRLTLTLTLWPRVQFDALQDEIGKAVDYAKVVEAAEEFLAPRGDRLLETLANAIAGFLLAEFPLVRVRVELRKFVLPQVGYVAAIVTRPL